MNSKISTAKNKTFKEGVARPSSRVYQRNNQLNSRQIKRKISVLLYQSKQNSRCHFTPKPSDFVLPSLQGIGTKLTRDFFTWSSTSLPLQRVDFCSSYWPPLFCLPLQEDDGTYTYLLPHYYYSLMLLLLHREHHSMFPLYKVEDTILMMFCCICFIFLLIVCFTEFLLNVNVLL